MQAVARVQRRLVVVLCNGSPVELPWAPACPAILELYLGGQAAPLAVVDVLFGAVCPSGKLAETFPMALQDVPSRPYAHNHPRQVVYREVCTFTANLDEV